MPSKLDQGLRKVTLNPHRISQLEAMEPRVRNWLLHRFKNRDLADEVTQRVLIRAATCESGFDHTKWPFEKWIWAIVNNTVIDYFRDMNRKRVLHTVTFGTYNQPIVNQTPLRAEIDQDSVAEIHRVIDTLLPSHQRVLKRHLAGEPLGCTDTMLCFARKALKEKLSLRGIRCA